MLSVSVISEEEYAIARLSRTSKIAQYEEELSELGVCSADGFKRSELKGLNSALSCDDTYMHTNWIIGKLFQVMLGISGHLVTFTLNCLK